MSTIAALVGNMFEDVEYDKPVEGFKQAGHTVVTVGIKAGSQVKGKQGKSSVTIDKDVTYATAADFDALFIPGGYSPDQLRVDDNVVRFVKQFVASGKPVFAICHAPQLLISADAVRGKTITGWKSIWVDLINAGATVVDKAVVQDGSIISSRGPDDIPAFVKASLEMLSAVPAGAQ